MNIAGRSRIITTVISTIAIIVLSLNLSACVTNEEQGYPENWEDIQPAAVPEIAALVPNELAQRGTLVVAAFPPYAPFMFKNSRNEIIGMEMDLSRAVAHVMGLEWQVKQLDFSLILPALSAGTIDLGASGFTDTIERRENYDFIDFLYAGIQWGQRVDKPVDRNNPCGLSVAVQRTTVAESDDVRPLSEQCVKEGKKPIEILSYATSDQAATALVLGRADAFASDSPVLAWAIERSDGALETSSEMFQAAPYGFAVPKNSPLGPAIAAALQHLMDTGDYERILNIWGVKEGHLDKGQVNGPLQPETETIAS
ncbi:ABC transporter substrate-binding protein [Corynebacterium sp. sy039]|uniref:ABC transporter substrate-binding protein n=1 Tax=Corynebacterium sp. sy039 TaxID=2599641 RepID=UPI0011B38B09|nr:ABC transporter substrate-binding protein [Corynebacterium sp. sy039]QDZ42518.1 ABC transporter substrate-binding protein [Corynebacterium sp. sy039]